MTTASFVTADDLARDLRALAVPRGGVLMVHSSLSSLGRVLGGAPAVVRAHWEIVVRSAALAALVSGMVLVVVLAVPVTVPV